MTITRPPRLSPTEVTRFRKEGYILYNRPVLPQKEFAALRAYFERLLAELPEGARPETMDKPHFQHPELFRWMFTDSILDLVEPILGPDIALYSSHFLCKPGGSGQRVPWHEDSSYWKGRLDPMDVVTVWLAIDPSTLKNGCMKVIPGSHRNGYSEYAEIEDKAGNVFEHEIREDQFDEEKAVPMILQPNQASLHESKMIHGSEANTSPLRRCGFTMRFISTRSKYRQPHLPGFKIYLARGVDHAGNEYGDPTVPNHEYLEHLKAG